MLELSFLFGKAVSFWVLNRFLQILHVTISWFGNDFGWVRSRGNECSGLTSSCSCISCFGAGFRLKTTIVLTEKLVISLSIVSGLCKPSDDSQGRLRVATYPCMPYSAVPLYTWEHQQLQPPKALRWPLLLLLLVHILGRKPRLECPRNFPVFSEIPVLVCEPTLGYGWRLVFAISAHQLSGCNCLYLRFVVFFTWLQV